MQVIGGYSAMERAPGGGLLIHEVIEILNQHGVEVMGCDQIKHNVLPEVRSDNSIAQAIFSLNIQPSPLTPILRFMLLARVQRAAKLGDTQAQRFVALCELNVTEATKQ
jgi:hypothetical protein